MLQDKRCLVVGTGSDAEKRALALLERDAKVRVVTGQPTAELTGLSQSGKIELLQREFIASDLDACWLVVLTDQRPDLASTISQLCHAQRVWFCAVDQPAISSFSHMALARSGPVTVAIGTDGRVPALAAHLRKEVQRLLNDAHLGETAEKLAELRRKLKGPERHKLLSEAVLRIKLAPDSTRDD